MLRLTLLACLVAFCISTATPSDAAAARGGPQVTRVVIRKDAHTLTLMAGDDVVATYKAAIGPGGSGPKRREGDRVTPVGRYHVTMHQPSQFKIFLRLDYPNAADRVRFAQLKHDGQLPENARIGGDIGIHGPPVALDPDVKASINDYDWTLGCIAVSDEQISEVARLVRDGTPVDIED